LLQQSARHRRRVKWSVIRVTADIHPSA
jgi:hypothetical protein